MSDTPDLSRIISLIMENPSLIAEISALAKKDAQPEESIAVQNTPEVPPTESKAVSAPPTPSKHEKRQRLLSAMKPYLKDERSRAIDSMLSVAEILDMVRNK